MDRFALRIIILNIVYAMGRVLDGSFYLHGTFCSSPIYPWNEWAKWIIAGDVALATGQVCGWIAYWHFAMVYLEAAHILECFKNEREYLKVKIYFIVKFAISTIIILN
jgi:hypothetical protein